MIPQTIDSSKHQGKRGNGSRMWHGPISITSIRLMIDGIDIHPAYYISHFGLLVSNDRQAFWRSCARFAGGSGLRRCAA